MSEIKNDTAAKVLRPILAGRTLYCRVPIARKIIGTGARDTKILLDSGISKSMCDLALHLTTGTYSLDDSLALKEGYSPSFSTTRLLQLLPKTISSSGRLLGMMLYPEEADGFGRSSLVGVVVDMDSGEQVKEFRGHPVSVLVRLIEFTTQKRTKNDTN